VVDEAPHMIEDRPHVKNQNFVTIILDAIEHPRLGASLNFQITFYFKNLWCWLKILLKFLNENLEIWRDIFNFLK